MIRQPNDPTLIITQTAHAWLAGQIALAWGNEQFRYPLGKADVVLAAFNHDIGWSAWEEAPQIDGLGRPLDFLEMPASDHVAIWERSVVMLARQNLYSALLTGMHGRHLIESRIRLNQNDSAMDKALLKDACDRLVTWERETIRQLLTRPDHAQTAGSPILEANKRLLQIFDLLSLILILGRVFQPVVDNVPAQSPTHCSDLTIRQLDSNLISCTPWPFKEERLSFTLQAYRLPQATFKTNKDFQAAWKSSKITWLRFAVVED